jgi:hypothetical protein
MRGNGSRAVDAKCLISLAPKTKNCGNSRKVGKRVEGTVGLFKGVGNSEAISPRRSLGAEQYRVGSRHSNVTLCTTSYGVSMVVYIGNSLS